MYSVVNVEKFRLYEPLIIDDHEENVHIPSIEYLDDLQEDTILERRIRSHKGDVDYLRVGLKGTNPSKVRWIEIKKVREK